MSDPYVSFFTGNCLDILSQLEAESIQCVVTSPPYWGLRRYDGDQDYIWNNHNDCEHDWVQDIQQAEGLAGSGKKHTQGSFNPRQKGWVTKYQIKHNSCSKCGAWKGAYGLEPTVEMYVQHTVEILKAIKRVLKPDGTVWWNIGDSYSSGGRPSHGTRQGYKQETNAGSCISFRMPESPGIKPKDLCLIPFRVALAAQADGWYVRSVIIWSKPNPMPESVKDRPTESHEYILMLTKSKNYYFDMEAVREKQSNNSHDRGDAPGDSAYQEARGSYFDFYHKGQYIPTGPLNIRSVWEITTQPFKGAHFATFPEEIPRRCILASTSEKGNCAKCGKPWVRVTEKTRLYQPGSGKAHNKPGGKRIDNPECHRMKYSQGPCVSVKTLGWEPSCKCAPASWKGSRFDDGKNLEIHPNVGRREDAHTKSQYEDGSTAKRLALLRQQARQNGEEYSSESITTGWENSCNCGAGIVRPVVLDPFGGSGTVSKVAKELGRKSIYIDTSEKYTEMARKRIELIPIPMEIT